VKRNNSEGKVTYSALEADLGTESLPVLKGKIRKYQTTLSANQRVCGMPVCGVVFVTRSGRRRDKIEELFTGTETKRIVVVTVL
jgi:hypothetical protein